jgi:hypothetical protein
MKLIKSLQNLPQGLKQRICSLLELLTLSILPPDHSIRRHPKNTGRVLVSVFFISFPVAEGEDLSDSSLDGSFEVDLLVFKTAGIELARGGRDS